MKILIKVFILMLLFISCKVKAEEKINYLESLTIENYNINFKKNVYEYDITIDDEDMLNINYELSDDNAYISIEGNGNFNKSNNIILINVNNDYKYKINVHKTLKWFDKYESFAVLIGRCIPIIRSLVSVPAGMAGMDLKRFLWMTSLGSLLWNLLLICAGAAAGSSWQKAVQYFGSYTQAAKIVLGTALLAGILFLIRRRLSSGSSET